MSEDSSPKSEPEKKTDQVICPEQINIVLTSELGIKTLEELARGPVSDLGRQIRLDTSYVGSTKLTRLNLQIHTSDVGANLYTTLKKIAETIPKHKIYQSVMDHFSKYNEYLGGWDTDKYPLKQDVAMYLKRGFEFVEDKWEVSREELWSSSKKGKVPHVRKSLFYALSKKFSNGTSRQDRLSTPDIGAIFYKDHSTVVLALKEIKQRIGESKVKSPDLVEMLIREGMSAWR